MALSTTYADIVEVRNALGENNTNVFLLATSALINKWSKYKPIRDAGFSANWPGGINGKYGLNLPTDWSYLQPRGGSPGGSPDEPGRLEDFRGYEHDTALAFPCIGSKVSDQVVRTIYPTGTGAKFNSFLVKVYNAVSAVMLYPSLLGLSDYYLCLKITIGGTTYYKTWGLVSAGTTGGVAIEPNCGITDLGAALGYYNLPYGVGLYSYVLGISSVEKANWTTVAPTTFIALPTETHGGIIYNCAGSFTVSRFVANYQDIYSDGMYCGDTDTGWKKTQIRTNSENWNVASAPSWISNQVYAQDHVTVVPQQVTWADRFYLGIRANSANNGIARTGSVRVFETTDNAFYDVEFTQAATSNPSTNVYVYDQGANAWQLTDGFTSATRNGTQITFSFRPLNIGINVQCYAWTETIGGIGGGADGLVRNGTTANWTINLNMSPPAGTPMDIYLSKFGAT